MIERFIAIDQVCAWPNLTLLPDGTILAAIYNQHCDAEWEADIECWGSSDGGRTWQKRGIAGMHEPKTNRMNVAAGLAANGDMLVLCSGWSGRLTRGDPGKATSGEVLPAWVCRSSDGGRTWQVTKDFPESPEPGMTPVIPFGDVQRADDGSLAVCGYACRLAGWRRYEAETAFFFRSRDDGRTWDKGVVIGAGDYDETASLHLGGGRWIAVSRTLKAAELRQFRSDDDGRSWRPEQALSLPGQHPAHLMRLRDGRILLSYGNRCAGQWGMDLRTSDDQGHYWSRPIRLVSYETPRAGYPSTVQLGDGRLVTAYYLDRSSYHARSHMAVVLWDPDDVLPKVQPHLG